MAIWYLPLTIALAVIAASAYLLKKALKAEKRCTIPGPRGLPYFGITPFLPRKDPYRYFKEVSKRYGDIFCCRLGSDEVIVLNTYDAIDEFFRNRGKVFSNRFLDIPDFVDVPLGFADLHYGDKSVELRTFTTRNLNKLTLGDTDSLERVINEETAQFCRYVEKSHKSEPRNPLDIFRNCTINILMQLVLGKPIEYDCPEIEKIHEDVTNVTLTPNVFIFHRNPLEKNVIKRLGIFPSDILKRSENGIEQLSGISYMEVERYLAMAKEGKANENCFMGNFLSTMKKKIADNVQTFMTENTLKGVVTNIFIGGIEATTVLASWMVTFLAKYPDMQKKIRDEIIEKIGEDKTPTFSDKNGMEYTNAFFLEMQRFGSLSPLGAPHTVAEDTEHEGCFIPKGTYIIANLWGAHRDEKLFDIPNIFRPERFLDDQGKFVNDKHVIMFSLGLRACPGQILVLRQAFVILVHILQKFEICLPEGVNASSIPDEGTYFGGSVVPPETKVRFCPLNCNAH